MDMERYIHCFMAVTLSAWEMHALRKHDPALFSILRPIRTRWHQQHAHRRYTEMRKERA